MLSSLELSEHEAHMALLTSALNINLLKVLGNKVILPWPPWRTNTGCGNLFRVVGSTFVLSKQSIQKSNIKRHECFKRPSG